MFPQILSFHPTTICAHNCRGCYLKRHKKRNEKERKSSFFLDLLDCAAEQGLKEVAMAVNSVTAREDDRNIEFLSVLGRSVKQNGMRFSVTTNFENVLNLGEEIFSTCDLVSLSYNEFLFQTCPSDFFESVHRLKAYGVKTNLNVLLTERLMEKLAQGLLEEMLRHSDTVYLILPKLIPLDFTVDRFLGFLAEIEPFFMNFETFTRVHLDNCVKPSIYPFSEIVPYSECGTSLISINPYGEVSFCAFEEPFLRLNEAVELKRAINEYYIHCPQRKRNRCPFIWFKQT